MQDKTDNSVQAMMNDFMDEDNTMIVPSLAGLTKKMFISRLSEQIVLKTLLLFL